MGFRSRALAEANLRVSRGWLRSLTRMAHPQAKRELMTLRGVGEKVADCVLLFGLGFREAFPVDTWVRRAMRAAYFHGRPVSDRDIRAFAAERFGPLAGYAQQYLFYQWRKEHGRARRRVQSAQARAGR